MAEQRPSVYVESTIPSYLTARLSREIVVAGHQRTTQDWWPGAKSRYRLLTSRAVLIEIARGNPEAAAKRLTEMAGIPILAADPRIDELAEVYRTALNIPDDAAADSVHLAYAVMYRLDYLVTWNCRHLANGAIIQQLLKLNQRLGHATPLIVTPESLIE